MNEPSYRQWIVPELPAGVGGIGAWESQFGEIAGFKGIGKRLKRLHTMPLKAFVKAHTMPITMLRKKRMLRPALFGPVGLVRRGRRRRGRRPFGAVPLAPAAYAPIQGSPLVAMPYAAPGLQGMWEAQLGEIEGFKRLKKKLKRVVKSKLFKYAAIGTAAYFGGPVAMKMVKAGISKGGGMKMIAGRIARKLRKVKRPAFGLLTAGALSRSAPAATGSVAEEREYGLEPGGYTPATEPIYSSEQRVPSYTPEVMQPGEGEAGAPPPAPALAGVGQLGTVAVIGIGAFVLYSLMSPRRTGRR